MNAYEYTILVDDVVVKTGAVHASSEEALENRIHTEIIPAFLTAENITTITYKQRFCDRCGGDNDVVCYYNGKDYTATCWDCRSAYFRKTRNYGTLKL